MLSEPNRLWSEFSTLVSLRHKYLYIHFTKYKVILVSQGQMILKTQLPLWPMTCSSRPILYRINTSSNISVFYKSCFRVTEYIYHIAGIATMLSSPPVAAVLEHEAIAGLSGSKLSGLQDRSSSRVDDSSEHSLDTMMKSVSTEIRTLVSFSMMKYLVMKSTALVYFAMLHHILFGGVLLNCCCVDE